MYVQYRKTQTPRTHAMQVENFLYALSYTVFANGGWWVRSEYGKTLF